MIAKVMSAMTSSSAPRMTTSSRFDCMAFPRQLPTPSLRKRGRITRHNGEAVHWFRYVLWIAGLGANCPCHPSADPRLVAIAWDVVTAWAVGLGTPQGARPGKPHHASAATPYFALF
jgi:hypothetical protein